MHNIFLVVPVLGIDRTPESDPSYKELDTSPTPARTIFIAARRNLACVHYIPRSPRGPIRRKTSSTMPIIFTGPLQGGHMKQPHLWRTVTGVY